MSPTSGVLLLCLQTLDKGESASSANKQAYLNVGLITTVKSFQRLSPDLGPML